MSTSRNMSAPPPNPRSLAVTQGFAEAITPVADPLIGQTIAGHRIEEILGQGGMGIVYRAIHLALDRPVALKLMRSDWNTTDGMDRFYREARMASAVRHPNLVTVFTGGTHEGRPFLVSELVIGDSLHGILERRLALPLSETIPILLQVLDGLIAIGAAGMVHRDIKPDNILITAALQAKITDFGLARELAQPGTTMAGHLYGTPCYMSPEQWSGQSLDARTDLFSLGVTAYRMLTGSLPFPGSSIPEILASLQRGSPNGV